MFPTGATERHRCDQLPSGFVRWWPSVGLSAAVALVALAACGDGDDASSVTTQRLAPSQISASTVVRPETPPACDPDDLAWWTAAAMPSGTTSTAVVRVRNDGSSWCEVDVAGSPSLSTEAEPSVWLEPAEWADLIVGSDGERCSPTVFDTVEVVVSLVIVEVPSIGVAACDPSLLAFYVADPPDGPCTDLDTVVVHDVLVVRNAGLASCELGDVVGTRADGRGGGVPAITALAAGDVVAVDLVPVGGECAAAPTAVEFESAGAVAVAELRGCPAGGSARPWFGTGDAPTSTDDVITGLDPFA